MDRETLLEKAIAFRAAVDECLPKLRSVPMNHFPKGACGEASDMLASYLEHIHGIESRYVLGTFKRGKRKHHSHAWLEIDGWIVDISADQFGQPSVIVSNDSEFHRQFEVRESHRKGGRGGPDFQAEYERLAERLRSPGMVGGPVENECNYFHDYLLIVSVIPKQPD